MLSSCDSKSLKYKKMAPSEADEEVEDTAEFVGSEEEQEEEECAS